MVLLIVVVAHRFDVVVVVVVVVAAVLLEPGPGAGQHDKEGGDVDAPKPCRGTPRLRRNLRN